MEYEFVNLLSLTMAELYKKNDDESYRRALRDLSFEICKYLETRGIQLNRTELTEEWLESDIRKEYRRNGLIK